MSAESTDGRIRALLVDDDRCIRNYYHALLGTNGFACREAHNGATAMQIILGSEPPEIILLDLHLPDFSGQEVLHRMERANVTIPTLVVTGFANEMLGLPQWAAASVKPVAPDTLVALMRIALSLVPVRSDTSLRRMAATLDDLASRCLATRRLISGASG